MENKINQIKITDGTGDTNRINGINNINGNNKGNKTGGIPVWKKGVLFLTEAAMFLPGILGLTGLRLAKFSDTYAAAAKGRRKIHILYALLFAAVAVLLMTVKDFFYPVLSSSPVGSLLYGINDALLSTTPYRSYISFVIRYIRVYAFFFVLFFLNYFLFAKIIRYAMPVLSLMLHPFQTLWMLLRKVLYSLCVKLGIYGGGSASGYNIVEQEREIIRDYKLSNPNIIKDHGMDWVDRV